MPECKPEWNGEAIMVFSRLPSLMAAEKPCPQLQPSLVVTSKPGKVECFYLSTSLKLPDLEDGQTES